MQPSDYNGLLETLLAFEINPASYNRPTCKCGCYLTDRELEGYGYIQRRGVWSREFDITWRPCRTVVERDRIFDTAPRARPGSSWPDPPSTTHHMIRCDGCQVMPITGYRFNHEEIDLCWSCFSKANPEQDFAVLKESIY